MKRQLKSFLAGFLACGLVVGLGVSVLAISGRMTIEVDPINIQVNGQTFVPTDVTGKEVPVFAYQGTTYAPLRALAEAYGLTVGYDAQTNMATVTDSTKVPPVPTVITPSTNADDIPDVMASADGKYQVAFITDVGRLKDKAFNQGTYDGVKLYAAANGKSYKYYQPLNGNAATDEDRYDAIETAIRNGAQVVVAAGFMQEGALRRAATEYPDTPFVFMDGYPLIDDAGNALPNVAGISFQVEQSGYLAGYAAVKEGFTALGFAGSGGGQYPEVNRYGYGFIQGANAAAAEMGKQVEMNYTYQYGATFQASPELQRLMYDWYVDGTEIVFSCGGGGSAFLSVAAAADATDAFVIGVDVDQSYDYDGVLTSAAKDLSAATQWALDKTYRGSFGDIGGMGTALGAAEGCVCLPTDTWRMDTYSVEEYRKLLARIASGSVTVDDAVLEGDAIATRKYSNVTVNYV